MENETVSIKEEKRLLVLNEILEKVSTLATAGLGLVAALAWNDAIRLVFTIYFPQPQDSVGAQFAYAIFVTVVVVLVTMYLGRSTRRIKEKLER
ncbi:MAG: DUF5654 family protein [Patescibacteria group bacterium]|jgi:hypothetical protein